MIKLIEGLPNISDSSAELLKIKFTYNSYNDIALFWSQDDDKCLISMLDGDMVIKNLSANISELAEFVKVISPKSIFSDCKTLGSLNLPFKRASVMRLENAKPKAFEGDTLSSGEVYELFKKVGFSLPPYEHFATDFCLRLNHGFADYLGERQKCVAVLYKENDNILINGIASLEKGMGSRLLSGIADRYKDKNIFANCEEKMEEFYMKNGFVKQYEVGYWVK